MRAQLYSRHGGPEVLELRHDLPEPRPGPREVLVEVRASAVNPVDWKLRRGDLRTVVRQTFPFIPGRDFYGVVLECGARATTVARGDAVYGLTPVRGPGSHADRVAVPEHVLALAPRRLHSVEAAGLPLVGLTAMQTIEAAHVGAGSRLLVQGGAGGVGSIVVQYARHLGAEVFATASARSRDYVRSLGAEFIDYHAERFEDRVSELDAVIDCVGGAIERRSFAVLRRGGHLVGIAGPAPHVAMSPGNIIRHMVPASAHALGQLTRGRRYHFVSVRPDHRRLARLAQLVDKGAIDLRIDRRFALEQLAEAHGISERGEAQGKLVIDHAH